MAPMQEFYDQVLDDVYQHSPPKRRFPHSKFGRMSFAVTTINMGPRTSTNAHRDNSDYAGGRGSNQALGSFDYTKGGHLVLYEPKLVIELAPGDVFFFNTSCITHGNIPVGLEEKRYSITNYLSGNLVRWRDQRCSASKAVGEPEVANDHAGEGNARWINACNLLKRPVLGKK